MISIYSCFFFFSFLLDELSLLNPEYFIFKELNESRINNPSSISLFTFTTSVQFLLLAEMTETQPGKKALAELIGGEYKAEQLPLL